MRSRQTTTGKPWIGMLAAALLVTLVGAPVPPLNAIGAVGSPMSLREGIPSEACDDACREDLRRARDATEKYWDVTAVTSLSSCKCVAA